MNSNIYLSPHFKLKEFVESPTANKYGIDNTPSLEIVNNLRHLCEGTLEPLREAMGLPIIITSGYRCKELNELITHHSNTSQHMAGQAVDFYVGDSLISDFKFQVSSESRRELLIKAFRLILTLESITFDQVIIYPSFIHVSFVSNVRNRRKITKGYGNGKYCALNREDALSIN